MKAYVKLMSSLKMPYSPKCFKHQMIKWLVNKVPSWSNNSFNKNNSKDTESWQKAGW